MPLRPTYPVQTDRLQLRPLRESDLSALLSYHSSPAVHKYLPMAPMDSETLLARLKDGPWSGSTLEKEGDALVLGVVLTATPQLVGEVMLRWLSEKDRCGELGYVFHPDHGGRGYATESAQAVLRLAFDELDLHRVIARINALNTPSVQLAERLGMRKEAHLVQSHWGADGWSDEVDFAILRSEWRGAGCAR
jgi:RimJ/RimL family protein N-acetyltransferase